MFKAGTIATLRSEWNNGEVLVWKLDSLRAEKVKDGQSVRIESGPDLNGFVTVSLNGYPVEVWHKCLSTWQKTQN